MGGKRGKEKHEAAESAGEAVKYFSNGKRFIDDLVRENERLRYKILDIEQELENARQRLAAGESSENPEELRLQLEAIRAHFETLRRENEDFRQRQAEVERQNESLLNLYVSSYQLHSTMDAKNVVSVIEQILLNLLGAEIFGLWMVDQVTGNLELTTFVDQENTFGGMPPSLPGHLLSTLAVGEKFVRPAQEAPGTDSATPLVCVPIRMDGRTVGALAVHKLLIQKTELMPVDHELLDLLTAQAAAALVGSRLFSGARMTIRDLGDAPSG